MLIRASLRLAVLAGLLLLVTTACTVELSRPQATAPAPTPSVSVSVSPGPTKTVFTTPPPTDEATQDPPPSPTVLVGKVVYVKLVELGSDQCDEDYATDVVLEITDGANGVQGVQYHDPDGKIGQGGSVGKRVRVTVNPDDYNLITLEQGSEPFPASGSCTQGNVPDSLYGNPFLEDVTYYPLTWEKLPAK